MDLMVFEDAREMRAFSRTQRSQGKRIGFVPTMGYLHEGHMSLLRAAREYCDVVIASIYVNPTQFSKNEDFDVYPKSINLYNMEDMVQKEDIEKLCQHGCSALFSPKSLYHAPSRADANASMVVGVETTTETAVRDAHCTWVEVEHLSQGLCASSRPHFFRGVCTVVSKLFHIVEPDVAFFGKKDFQQYRVIQRMARDLDFGIDIIGVDIVREKDGLAMSSRNALLTPENRQKCLVINQSLQELKRNMENGAKYSCTKAAAWVAQQIEEKGGRVDYVEVVDSHHLVHMEEIVPGSTLVAVAAFFGSVRLIDNIEL